MVCHISDPDLLEPLSIQALRENKIYQKLVQKKEKDFEVLRKKHEKVSKY